MPRVKTYSARSGFVYQYQFTFHESGADGDRYRFATTQDRQAAFDAVVFLPRAPLQTWEAQEGRTLTPTERYALAKMALFAAFDNADHTGKLPTPIEVNAGQVRDLAGVLDL